MAQKSTRSLVSPVMVVSLIGLVVALAVGYVATQGNLGNTDTRSQASNRCAESCRTETCNPNTNPEYQNEQKRARCISTCVLKCFFNISCKTENACKETENGSVISSHFCTNTCASGEVCCKIRKDWPTHSPWPTRTPHPTRTPWPTRTPTPSLILVSEQQFVPAGACGPSTRPECLGKVYATCLDMGCSWGYACEKKPSDSTDYVCSGLDGNTCIGTSHCVWAD